VSIKSSDLLLQTAYPCVNPRRVCRFGMKLYVTG